MILLWKLEIGAKSWQHFETDEDNLLQRSYIIVKCTWTVHPVARSVFMVYNNIYFFSVTEEGTLCIGKNKAIANSLHKMWASCTWTVNFLLLVLQKKGLHVSAKTKQLLIADPKYALFVPSSIWIGETLIFLIVTEEGASCLARNEAVTIGWSQVYIIDPITESACARRLPV